MWDVNPPSDSDPVHGTRPAPGPSAVWMPSKTYEGHVSGSCRAVAFNPRFGMMASAGEELAFWLPETKSSDAMDTD